MHSSGINELGQKVIAHADLNKADAGTAATMAVPCVRETMVTKIFKVMDVVPHCSSCG